MRYTRSVQALPALLRLASSCWTLAPVRDALPQAARCVLLNHTRCPIDLLSLMCVPIWCSRTAPSTRSFGTSSSSKRELKPEPNLLPVCVQPDGPQHLVIKYDTKPHACQKLRPSRLSIQATRADRSVAQHGVREEAGGSRRNVSNKRSREKTLRC
jgi:hypothetical protein